MKKFRNWLFNHSPFNAVRLEALIAWMKDFVHNTLIHPIMPLLPREWADEIHDKNAQWAFRTDLEKLSNDTNYLLIPGLIRTKIEPYVIRVYDSIDDELISEYEFVRGLPIETGATLKLSDTSNDIPVRVVITGTGEKTGAEEKKDD